MNRKPWVMGSLLLIPFSAGIIGLAVRALEWLGLLATLEDAKNPQSATRAVLRDILSVPWPVYAIVLIGTAGYLIWKFETLTRPMTSNPVPPSIIQVGELQKELASMRAATESTAKQRDDALTEIQTLRSQIADRFPVLQGTIYEILTQDPTTGADLWGAITLEITNQGAATTITAFRVIAETIYGATVETQVILNDGFRMLVNSGKDCIDYLPEHFMQNRARANPVQRGIPLIGVLPVIFKSVKDFKEINAKSVRVQFVDAIYGDDGKPKQWETLPVLGVRSVDIVPVTKRPGLPSIHPV